MGPDTAVSKPGLSAVLLPELFPCEFVNMLRIQVPLKQQGKLLLRTVKPLHTDVSITAYVLMSFDFSIRGVIKKFLARYALVRFIELKSLSVGHLI